METPYFYDHEECMEETSQIQPNYWLKRSTSLAGLNTDDINHVILRQSLLLGIGVSHLIEEGVALKFSQNTCATVRTTFLTLKVQYRISLTKAHDFQGNY